MSTTVKAAAHTELQIGDFAATKGYFRKVGEWVSDQELCGFAVGKIVAIDNFGVTLEFAAGNTVKLGTGLLSRPLKWEVSSWHKMRGVQELCEGAQ